MRLTTTILAPLLLIVASSSFASTQDDYKKTSKLLVSWTKSPTTQINIGFQPDGKSKKNFVVYDTVSHKYDDPKNAYKYYSEARDTYLETKCSRYSGSKFRYVSTSLKDLKADTKYFFRTYSL